jgi:hypothetical protein
LRKWLLIAYAYSAVLWAAFALVLSYQSYSIAKTYGTEPMPYRDYLPTYGARYFSLFILTPLVLLVVRTRPFSGQHRIRSLVFYCVLAIVFLFAFATIRWCLYPVYESVSARYVPRTFSSLWGLARDNSIDLILWMYLPMVLLAHGLEYRREARARELETAELMRNITEQQLASLKMQLQPEFLFASLEQIDSLIKENGETAEELLLRLSEVLRAAVDCQRVDVVPLRDELNTVNSYLAIERIRLGGRLEVKIESACPALECFVPPLLLQGLAANAIDAIRRGKQDPSWITLNCNAGREQLEINVLTSVGAAEAAFQQLERGLQITGNRLESLYGSDMLLHVSKESGRLRIRLQLPLLTAAVENTNA